MAGLDAILAQCRDQPPFTTGIVRDISNRTNRDWPWWGVEIEQTQLDGAETRRATATISQRSNQDMSPGRYEATWRVRIWTGVSEDSFSQRRTIELEWSDITAEHMTAKMTELLDEANAVIDRILAERVRH